MKCARNGFIKAGYKTLEGTAYVKHIRVAHKEEKSATTLKVMPKITASHVNPNNFEKVKVTLAFHLFSGEILRGLFFYKNEITSRWSDTAPTQAFILLMVKLIEAMTQRIPPQGLKPGSSQEKDIKDALECLNKWEAFCHLSKLYSCLQALPRD